MSFRLQNMCNITFEENWTTEPVMIHLNQDSIACSCESLTGYVLIGQGRSPVALINLSQDHSGTWAVHSTWWLFGVLQGEQHVVCEVFEWLKLSSCTYAPFAFSIGLCCLFCWLIWVTATLCSKVKYLCCQHLKSSLIVLIVSPDDFLLVQTLLLLALTGCFFMDFWGCL